MGGIGRATDDAGLGDLSCFTDLHALLSSLGRHFGRTEAWTLLGAYLTGFLSPLARKNGWQLAEQAGDATPHALQDPVAVDLTAVGDIGYVPRSQRAIIWGDTGVLRGGPR